MTSLPRSAGALARPVVRPAIRSSRQIGRKPRPVLLFLVYGVFLVIVGVTATAQVMLASVHVSTSALNQAVLTDTQVVRGFVDDLLKPADLTAPIDRRRPAVGARGRPQVVHHAARDHPGRDPASRRDHPRERRPDRRAPRPELGRLADGPGRPHRGLAGGRGRERGRTGRPRDGHGDPRIPPAHPGRRRRGRGRGVARRHPDHDRDRRGPAGRDGGHGRRRDRGRGRAVPRLPGRAGADLQPDARAHRGDPPRPVHRDAQPRRPGRDHRRRDRAPPRDRRRPRDRDPRHRQLPDPQRHLGPRRGRRGDPRGAGAARAAGVGRAGGRPLRPGRVPRRGRRGGGGDARAPDRGGAPGARGRPARASATATTCRSPSAAPSPGSPRTATR